MPVPPFEELFTMQQRAAAVVEAVAQLADREAERAQRVGDHGRRRAALARAQRARCAAEASSCAARRLFVRHQVRGLLGVARPWREHLRRPRPELGVPVALIATDLEGTVRVWNEGAEQLYGWAPSEALGRPVGELMVGPEDAELARRILRTVRAAGAWEGEFWVRRQDGTRCLAYVHDAVVRAADGQAVGVVGLSIDLSPGSLVPLPELPADSRFQRG